ncbi:MAG: tetratricopeptide repeat protein [Endomicrobia bacterium]|nr:tetratricopeptide repeat protein [Endomicrobiia bacterium]
MKFLVFIFFILNWFAFCETTLQQTEEIKKLIRNNECQRALEILSEYEAIISTFPEISYYLGICYYKLKDYNNAEKYFEMCLSYNYNTKEIYYNLGLTKYKLKKYKDAIELLKNLENNHFLEPESLYVSIACYLKLNDRNNAIYTFKKLISKYPYSLYVVKSQKLLDKVGIDYSKFLNTKQLSHRVVVSLGYGKDTNISYTPQQEYKELEDINLKDNFFSYYVYASIFTNRFYSYYRYTDKNHSNYQNFNYDYLTHSLFLKYRLYKEDDFFFSTEVSADYYEYSKPYSYNLLGELNLEFLTNKDTSLKISYLYMINQYFERLDYLEGATQSIDCLFRYTSVTNLSGRLSFKLRDTLSSFVSSEYNYSYFLLINTTTYLNHIYTPLIRNYSYNSVILELLLDTQISENLKFSGGINYEYFVYFPKYEYYEKIEDIYLYDVEQNRWFVYSQNSWIETQQPQLKKISKERIDNTISLHSSLIFELIENVELILSYNYILNKSTINTYHWNKEVYQASLKISF